MQLVSPAERCFEFVRPHLIDMHTRCYTILSSSSQPKSIMVAPYSEEVPSMNNAQVEADYELVKVSCAFVSTSAVQYLANSVVSESVIALCLI